MSSVRAFNGLNGVVKRSVLTDIQEKARQEEQIHLAKKLERFLEANKNKRFDINVQNKLLEIVPASMLPYLEELKPGEMDETGLNKPVSPEEIYTMITNMVIEMMESEKDLAWHKPWTATGNFGESATNLKTKTVYRGINDFLLNVSAPYRNGKPFDSPFFLSFKQMQDMGGSLKKGSQGHIVIYFSKLMSIKQESPKLSFSTSDARKYNAYIKKNRSKINNTAVTQNFAVLKYYKVFSVDDMTGIKLPKIEIEEKTFSNIEVAEAIVANMPNPPKLNLEDKGDSAHYMSSRDQLTMPKRTYFDEEQFFYSVFFHELIHSTGHQKRLNRPLGNKFGSPAYSFEELIAEFGALFLCAEAGILYKTIDNSAQYIKGWKAGVIKNAKADNKFIFRAVSKSQAAADYILDRDENKKPKYLKTLKQETVKKKKTTPKKTVKKPTPVSRKKKEVKDTQLALFGAAINTNPTDILNHTKEINTLKAKRNRSKSKKNKLKLQDLINEMESYVVKDAEGKSVGLKVKKKDNPGLKISVTPLVSEPVIIKIPEQKEVQTVVNKGFQQNTPPGALSLEKKVVPVQTPGKTKTVSSTIPKGFTLASNKPKEEDMQNVFYLPGEIGKWLGKQQRYKLMILAHGESGAGKSELVKQLANSFLDAGFTGGFFDLEQGGLISKDTQESIDRNISHDNLSKIAFTDEAENGLESVKAVADHFDFIVVDSWQKLNTPMTRLDELRHDHPNTIWIVITQETTDGKAKGGSQTTFDPPVRIKAFKEDNTFVNNYAEIMKNRGNQPTVGTHYNMYSKKVLSNTEESTPGITPGGNLVITAF